MASNTIPGDSPITVNDFQELRTKFIKVFKLMQLTKVEREGIIKHNNNFNTKKCSKSMKLYYNHLIKKYIIKCNYGG